MPDTEYHRRQFEAGYAWFKSMKRACSTVSLIKSDAELCEALLKIAAQAESANAALRSLESLSENELKVLPDRNLVEKIQLVTCSLTPRDKAEAITVIENSCGQEPVTLRIKHSLRSLLGTSSDILLLTRVALHDSSSRARMVRTFQMRTKNLTEPANIKWIRLGQLMVAVHLLNEAERPPNSQTTFVIRRSANFLLDALGVQIKTPSAVPRGAFRLMRQNYAAGSADSIGFECFKASLRLLPALNFGTVTEGI